MKLYLFSGTLAAYILPTMAALAAVVYAPATGV